MSDAYEFAEEELVRTLAPPLRPPSMLRQRVLTEALAAESRRSAARRTAALTGTLVLAVGLVLGLIPVSSGDERTPQSVVAAGPEWDQILNRNTAVALLSDRDETIATAGIGEWDQVEAFVLLRQAGRVVVSGTP